MQLQMKQNLDMAFVWCDHCRSFGLEICLVSFIRTKITDICTLWLFISLYRTIRYLPVSFTNIVHPRLQHGYIITSHCLVWDVITHPCPNFSEVSAWIRNYIPLKTGTWLFIHSEINNNQTQGPTHFTDIFFYPRHSKFKKMHYIMVF